MRKISTIIWVGLSLFATACNHSDEPQPVQIPPAGCLPVSLSNGLVAFYPFGNGSLDDVSGNNHHLTNPTTAAAGVDREGNPNCAFGFNRSNSEFLTLQDPIFLDDLASTGLSISFWYLSNDNSYGSFVDRGGSNTCTSGQWAIQYVNNVLDWSAIGARTYSYGVSNSWEHIVVTSNSGMIQLFRNGVLVGSSTDFNFCLGNNPAVNQGDLFIGNTFDGRIDDIIIYNRGLTDAEVTALHNLAACCG